MGLFTKPELAWLYATKALESIKFGNVLLLSKTWPTYFEPSPSFNENRAAADKETYEQEEREAAEAEAEDTGNPIHCNMLILRDPSGCFLLDGYDMYPYYAYLVACGRMPLVWKMTTIRYERELTGSERMQLAMYASMRRVFHRTYEYDANVVQYLVALQHVMASEKTRVGRRSWKNTRTNTMKYVIDTTGIELTERGKEKMIVTAGTLMNREGFTQFLLTYKEDLVKLSKFNSVEMFSGSEVFGTVTSNDFTDLYYHDWWCKESIGAQFMITLVAMGFYSTRYVCEIDRPKRLWKQFIRLFSGCEQLTSTACRRLSHLTMEKALLASFQPTSGREVPRRSFAQAKRLNETILYVLSTAILEVLFNSVDSMFVPEFDENGYDIQPVLPDETKLKSNEFNKVWEKCLDTTATKLIESGLVHIREMVQMRVMCKK